MTLLLTLLLACRGGEPCTTASCEGNVAHGCDRFANRTDIECTGDNPACVVAKQVGPCAGNVPDCVVTWESAICVTDAEAACTTDDASTCDGDTRHFCDTAAGYTIAYDCAAANKICTDETEDRLFRCQEE